MWVWGVCGYIPTVRSSHGQMFVVFIIIIIVYYESRKGEVKRRLVNEGRCDERLDPRLKAKVEESTYLTYTGLRDKTN